MVSEPAKFQAGGCAGVSGRLLPLVAGSLRPFPAISEGPLTIQTCRSHTAGALGELSLY